MKYLIQPKDSAEIEQPKTDLNVVSERPDAAEYNLSRRRKVRESTEILIRQILSMRPTEPCLIKNSLQRSDKLSDFLVEFGNFDMAVNEIFLSLQFQ